MRMASPGLPMMSDDGFNGGTFSTYASGCALSNCGTEGWRTGGGEEGRGKGGREGEKRKGALTRQLGIIMPSPYPAKETP